MLTRSMLGCLLISITLTSCGVKAHLIGELNESSRPATNDDDSTPEATAINEPISVGGAFLSCGVSPDEAYQKYLNESTIAVVACQIAEDDGQAMSLPEGINIDFSTYNPNGDLVMVEQLERIEDQGSIWILAMTTFSRPWLMLAKLGNNQEFETEIDMGDYTPPQQAISELEAANADEALRLGPELLMNGSFSEPQVINPQFTDGSTGWSHYDPSVVIGWQAEWNNSTCNNPVRVEVQRNNIGQQWLDLAGSCAVGTTPPAGGSNLKLTQSIATTAGSSYRLSFRYLMRNSNAIDFRIEVNDEALFDSNVNQVTPRSWQSVELDFVAQTDQTTFSVMEIGRDPLSGTLFDSISVKEISRRLIP
ncbi:hypothetical protein [Pseudobacteriovorax antillogorgiicola]|uniref:Uncharacterized protein n=1 Tax=Pseudobacteriovorax antillogorgiicola TaxID=1513793 RepID=A0A1Y6BEV3_9BACT|nr:hypothetical protein [Pseudobacteriovorax antillogorgiicola]TCS57493.1 hypothetical protein EDD56_103233 [Pseudobacteriovorax antillogorgiicola]SMF00466.1 hypothetical protein SAMN06296036_103100 [Pseudobacteriovorax antillogorgiicola]